MTYEELLARYHQVLRDNANFGLENRHLRCVMIEAAHHIDQNKHPHLVRQLYQVASHWVNHEDNPYPQHDNIMNDQFSKYINTPVKP